MRHVFFVLSLGIIALGAIHLAATPRFFSHLTGAALWFGSGGLAIPHWCIESAAARLWWEGSRAAMGRRDDQCGDDKLRAFRRLCVPRFGWPVRFGDRPFGRRNYLLTVAGSSEACLVSRYVTTTSR